MNIDANYYIFAKPWEEHAEVEKMATYSMILLH